MAKPTMTNNFSPKTKGKGKAKKKKNKRDNSKPSRGQG
jgi:hypothetical protein